MRCIDLRNRFGRTCRIALEESYQAERPESRAREKAFLQIIPCRYGHIFPWGNDLLGASVDGFPKVAGRLRRLKCVEVVQDGDFGELTVAFNVSAFAKVAEVMRPRRRRQVSQSERERLRAMGFKKASESHADSQSSGRESVSEGRLECVRCWAKGGPNSTL